MRRFQLGMGWFFHRERGLLALALMIVAGAGVVVQAIEDEPVKIPSRDPLKARSAEENVSGGRVQSVQDKRLDVRDRVNADKGIGPPPAATLIVPATPPANGATPPAVVDASPVPHVDIGLETRGTKTGVLVVSVREKSPASEAEIQVNDLIKRFGERAAVTPKDLDETLNQYLPLARVPLTVERNGKPVQLVLTLPAEHIPHAPPPPWGTADKQQLLEERASDLRSVKDVVRDDALGWVLGHNGETLVAVMQILPDSAAQQAGLQLNDVIVAVDGRHFTDPGQVSVAVHQHPPGQFAGLWVRRGTQEGLVALRIPGPVPAETTAQP